MKHNYCRLIWLFTLITVAIASTDSNSKSAQNKDSQTEKTLDCRSSDITDDLNDLMMPEFSAWQFVIVTPIALVLQLSFLALSWQTPRLRAQPGDILIGAFLAELILSIHWFIEGIRAVIMPSGAPSFSPFCLISSGLSLFGGYIWNIYNFLFFAFIGLSMQNSLSIKLISRRNMHLLVWVTGFLYVIFVFAIGVNGKNLYGTCSVAFSEVSTPLTSIVLYFAFLALSIVFFYRFNLSIPNTSFYERQRIRFHLFTRLYLILYLSIFGIISFCNSYLFVSCQYFQSYASVYIIKFGHLGKLVSALFLPILRFFDPYLQQTLQIPSTQLQKVFHFILKICCSSSLISPIEKHQDHQDNDEDPSRSTSFGGLSAQKKKETIHTAVLRMKALSTMSMKYIEERKKSEKNPLLLCPDPKQLSLTHSHSSEDDDDFSVQYDPDFSINTERSSKHHTINMNLLRKKSHQIEQQINKDFKTKRSLQFEPLRDNNKTPQSQQQRPKRATEFLKKTTVSFLTPVLGAQHQSPAEMNEKLFKLFHSAPFLLEWEEYETSTEAEDFCDRVESFLTSFKNENFNDAYYKMDIPRKVKQFKDIDTFFGSADDENIALNLIQSQIQQDCDSQRIQAETVLDSKDHFIMILQRNIKTAVLCRILSGIQLQFIRKKQYCKNLDISIDSYSNIFNNKNLSSLEIRPSRVLTLFPTLRKQESIFEEVKVLQFSDESIKNTIKQAPKQLLDSDAFDVVVMRVYAPMVFHSLIKLQCQGLPDSIEESFNLSSNMQQIRNASGSDGGKSGQFFFFSNDNRFLLKTIKLKELHIILNRLPKYFKYLKQHPNSLIAKILGVYTFEGLSESPIHLILMQNIAACTKNQILRTYDIKGSTFDRRVIPAKDIEQNNRGNHDLANIQVKGGSISLRKLILKDFDFFLLEQTIEISPDEQQRVFLALQEDAEFLCDCGLIDYSLIVFKVDKRSDNRASTSVSSDSVETSIVNMKQDLSIQQDFYKSQSTFDPEIYYHIGIIDYLQLYSMQKRLEKVAKRFLHFNWKLDTSSQDPETYSKRFISSMKQIFNIS